MANSKQNTVPEGVKRSPGKSKFSIPRKEAPPIDGSYLDRLFADYDRQTKELQGLNEVEQSQNIESPEPPTLIEQPPAKLEEPAVTLTTAPPAAEIPEQTLPAGPVPFPHNESGSQREFQTAVAVPPQAPPATRDVENAARLTRRKPATEPSEASDDDTQLIDKWKKKHRLGKGEVKVLRAMLGMCREAGGDACYIKIPQLMQAAELRERQTQMVLRGLRELGLIEKVAEYSNIDRLGTKYRVALDAD